MCLFVLRDIISDSVLLGLNVTSQVSAYLIVILTRSALRRSAEEIAIGSSTIINRLMSSANTYTRTYFIYAD